MGKINRNIKREAWKKIEKQCSEHVINARANTPITKHEQFIMHDMRLLKTPIQAARYVLSFAEKISDIRVAAVRKEYEQKAAAGDQENTPET